MRILRYQQLNFEKGIPFSREHLRRLELAGQFPKRVRYADGGDYYGYVEKEIDELRFCLDLSNILISSGKGSCGQSKSAHWRCPKNRTWLGGIRICFRRLIEPATVDNPPGSVAPRRKLFCINLRGDPFPTIGALVSSRTTGALPAKFRCERLVQTTSLLAMVESRPPQSPAWNKSRSSGLKYRLEGD